MTTFKFSDSEYQQLFPCQWNSTPTSLPETSNSVTVADLRPSASGESPNTYWPLDAADSDDSESLGWLNFANGENEPQRRRGCSSPNHDDTTVWTEELRSDSDEDDSDDHDAESSLESPAVPPSARAWEVEDNYIYRGIDCWQCKLCLDRGTETLANKRGNLERHLMSIIHTPKSFTCTSCFKSYTRPDALKRHKRRSCKALRPQAEATGT